MPQLEMFAPSQHKCVFCGASFVPMHRDVIQIWEAEFTRDEDWLAIAKWAAYRVYQENLKYCSPECLEMTEAVKQARIREEIRENLKRKYR